MRVLISGAAGFLGSNLSDLHISDGDELVGVDNFITGKRENLEHVERAAGPAGWARFRFV